MRKRHRERESETERVKERERVSCGFSPESMNSFISAMKRRSGATPALKPGPDQHLTC